MDFNMQQKPQYNQQYQQPPYLAQQQYPPGGMMPAGTNPSQSYITNQPGVMPSQNYGATVAPNQPVRLWMPSPPQENIPGCPMGLEYLTLIDQILVKEYVNMLEVMTGIEQENKYDVLNNLGQRIFFARERSSFVGRQYEGGNHSFVMHIEDNLGREVMRINRPYRCSCGACCACSDSNLRVMMVEAPVGVPIGEIKEVKSGCDMIFQILDAAQSVVLMMKGPGYCATEFCCRRQDINFVVTSPDNTVSVGNIARQYAGYMQETFTDADNFGVQFPMDLDVKAKALLLAGAFFIDYLFFENGNKNRNQNRNHRHF